MSRILDADLLTQHFKDHDVQEVYVIPEWKTQRPLHFYVVMRDTALTASLLHRLIYNCTEEYRLSVTAHPDAPLLMNKKLIWYEGEWRGFL